jgi:hypothetical protein
MFLMFTILFIMPKPIYGLVEVMDQKQESSIGATNIAYTEPIGQ